MTNKMINQECIDKMIYDALEKLPPRVTNLNLTMIGKKNVGCFNCIIGTDGEKVKEKRYTDKDKEMGDFIKHLRDTLDHKDTRIRYFELTATYDSIEWRIGGITAPVFSKNKEAS